jgi:acetyltransferase-like isoleucine patch superfamily enzyme
MKNIHNFTIPKYTGWGIEIFSLKCVHVWKYTYWTLDIHMWWEPGEKLSIGNYCSISHGVTFILWGNHVYKSLLTYPLGIMNNIPWAHERESYNNWTIDIGDDVRIGTGAKIMSWVTVGQWAIIAAYAVVTQSVPPYAIVWWVPAKIIKHRFPADVIEKLVKIDYNNIPISKLLSIYDEISKEWFDVDKVCELLT